MRHCQWGVGQRAMDIAVVDGIGELRTVRRPREIVPTNLSAGIVLETIFAVSMCCRLLDGGVTMRR